MQDNEWHKGIVRILAKTKPRKTMGTGFILRESNGGHLIVTAAHVVRDAVDVSRYEDINFNQSIQFIFHANGKEGSCFIEKKYWNDPENKDIAILRLSQKALPYCIEPLRLGTSSNIKEHKFETYGFPNVNPSGGIGGKGTIDEYIPYKNSKRLQLTSSQVTPGFSGAPVQNKQTHRVVGVITHAEPPELRTGIPTGRWTQTALATPSSILVEICPELQLEDICPYKGLLSFTEEDADFFFSREELVEEMAKRLRQEPNFLAVVGSSGSGKSSLVQAGLIAKLRKNEIHGFNTPTIITLRPSDTNSPLEALVEAFQDIFSISYIGEQWEEIQEYIKNQRSRTVIYIDQFEELFANHPDNSAGDIIHGLHQLLIETNNATLLISIRSDFYGFLIDSALGNFLDKNSQINLPAKISDKELRNIIREPSKLVGLDIQDGLEDLIISHLKNTKNPLILLEFTLKQLWEAEHTHNLLTIKCYQEYLGGVTGSIARWANRAYSELSECEKTLARRIFTRLIHYGGTLIPYTRRRRFFHELVNRSSEESTIRELIEKLSSDSARLLVTTRKDSNSKIDDNSEDAVEIIHDSLIDEWLKLRDWIEQGTSFLLWQQRLDLSLEDWKINQKEEGYLLTESPLELAETYLKDYPDELNLDERKYIKLSLEKRERFNREQIQQKDKLSSQAQIIFNEQLTSKIEELWNQGVGSFQLSMLLAIESMKRNPSPKVAGILWRGLELLPYSFAVLNLNDTARTSTLSADGKYKITAANRKMILVQDAHNLKEISRLILSHPAFDKTLNHSGSTENSIISPNGKYQVTADIDCKVQVKEISSNRIFEISPSARCFFVSKLTFSPDSKYLDILVSTYKSFYSHQLIDIDKNWDFLKLDSEDLFLKVTFSPDGKYLAVQNRNNVIQLYGVTESDAFQKPLWQLDSGVRVYSITFSSNSINLLLHSGNTIEIYQSNSGERVARLAPSVKDYTGNFNILLSPNRKQLVTRGNRSSQIWDTSSGREIMRLSHKQMDHGERAPGNEVAYFSWKDNFLAVVDEGGIVQLLEAESQWRIFQTLKHHDIVSDVAFSPDSKHLATNSGDGIARLWNIANGKIERNFDLAVQYPAMSFGNPLCIFSSDGRYLITAIDTQDVIQVFETATGKKLALLGYEQWITADTEEISNLERRVLFKKMQDGSTQILEEGTRHEIARVIKQVRSFELISNSASNNFNDFNITIKFSNEVGDNIVSIQESKDNQEIARLVHKGRVNNFALSSDSRYLATASNDGTAQLLRLMLPEELIAEVCKRLTRNLTQEEWNRYIGSEPYNTTCTNLA